MRRILMAAVAALMLSAQAMAQTNETEGAKPKIDKTEMLKRHTDRMAKTYGLDEAQTAKLLQLNTIYAGKFGPMGRPGMGPRRPGMGRPEGGEGTDSVRRRRPSREDMEKHMKEMRANMEAYNKELKGIMTSEQYAKYEADMKNRMARQPRRVQKSDSNE